MPKVFSTTDFRKDIKKITVPTLIVHGDSDKIVPFENSSERTAEMIPHAELIVYADGPHGIFYTHRALLNKDLLNFFAGKKTCAGRKRSHCTFANVRIFISSIGKTKLPLAFAGGILFYKLNRTAVGVGRLNMQQLKI